MIVFVRPHKKKDFDSFSVSRDIFQARLDSFALKTNRYLESAIIGEKRLSGRAPEQRGNGLKFVLESFINKNWELYFQSGSACCTINSGKTEFVESDFVFSGCLAIMKF